MQTNDVAYANGVPGLRVEMTYDGQSRRVRKVEKSFSAQNNAWSVTSDTRYLYDGWNLIAELTVNQQSGIQNLKSTHAWGLDLSGTTTGAGGVGGLVFTALYSTTQTTANNSQPPPTSVLAPCYDGNGNVLAYCDAATGQTLGRYEYDPFGRLLLREEDARIAGRASHLFSTKHLDAETGLSYYGYRFYCGEWGRWINRDPIEEAGGVALHQFVLNRPTVMADNLGRDPIPNTNPPRTSTGTIQKGTANKATNCFAHALGIKGYPKNSTTWPEYAAIVGCTEVSCSDKCPDGKYKVLTLEDEGRPDSAHAYRKDGDSWCCKYGEAEIFSDIADPYEDYDQVYRNNSGDTSNEQEKCYCCPKK